jgi:hypothetical protein
MSNDWAASDEQPNHLILTPCMWESIALNAKHEKRRMDDFKNKYVMFSGMLRALLFNQISTV